MRQWSGRQLVAGAAAVLALCAGTVTAAGPADAASEGGASTRVVGRGNIVTSILGWTSGGRRPSSGAAPRCAWRTLTDAQLEWLVSVAAQAVGLGLATPLLDPLRPYLDAAELPDGDLQGYVCGWDTYELRFVPSPADRTAQQVLFRQMITRLPTPEPTVSPPADTVVPVGQPVFVSLDADHWQPVEGTLSHGGVTAQVRAQPVGLRVITGDPVADTASCDGPGRPFRPDGGASAAVQARHPDACTVTYRTASAGHRSGRSSPGGDRRPDTWLGTVTVLWSAQWRVDQGPWIDLGIIPRTRLVVRAARDLTTSLEAPG